jgi:hypothetical protein
LPAVSPLVQGDTWKWEVRWLNPLSNTDPPVANPNDPIDLTGYSARCQVRASAGEPAVLTLTSDPGGGLTIDAVNGRINGRAAPADTADIASGMYLWEVEVFNADDRYTLVSQQLAVKAQIST